MFVYDPNSTDTIDTESNVSISTPYYKILQEHFDKEVNVSLNVLTNSNSVQTRKQLHTNGKDNSSYKI